MGKFQYFFCSNYFNIEKKNLKFSQERKFCARMMPGTRSAKHGRIEAKRKLILKQHNLKIIDQNA